VGQHECKWHGEKAATIRQADPGVEVEVRGHVSGT